MKKMIIIAVMCLTFLTVTANSSLAGGKPKIPKPKKAMLTLKAGDTAWIYFTGYYCPERNQSHFAHGSFEADKAINCPNGITASGKLPKKGFVSVDPSIIPLGSEIFIHEDEEIATAEDKGGNIKGNRGDKFTGHGQRGLMEAYKITGWKRVTVLKTGGS